MQKKRYHVRNRQDYNEALVTIVCLNIPDSYRFMSPELIELLKRKVHPILGI